MVAASIGLPIAGHPCNQRLSLWLRRWSAKELARMFPPTSPRTAERWKTGDNWPHSAALFQMVERWGEDFLTFVFAPVLDTETDIMARVERVERDMALIKEELARDRDRSPAGNAAQSLRRVARATGQAVAAARAPAKALSLLVAGLIGWQAVAGDDDIQARMRPAKRGKNDHEIVEVLA